MIEFKRTVVLAPTSTTADRLLGSRCQFILAPVQGKKIILPAIKLEKYSVISATAKNFLLAGFFARKDFCPWQIQGLFTLTHLTNL